MSRFVLLLVVSLAPATAFAQRCATTVFSDGVCDCGCGSIDPDCPSGATFTACQVSHCPAPQVPWEHDPDQCMSSACGDGWKAATEACDDGNALASGGCNATCSAVSAGYVCGERATGCRVAPLDAGQPMADAGMADAGSTNEPADAGSGGTDAGTSPTPMGGCTSVPSELALVGLAAALLRRRAHQ